MKNLWIITMVLIGLTTTTISCTSTRLARTWVDTSVALKPVSSITVIAGMHEDSLDLFFENQWLEQFEAIGVEAVPGRIRFPTQDAQDQDHEQEIINAILSDSTSSAVLISRFAAATQKDVFIPIYRSNNIMDDPVYRQRPVRTGMTAVDIYFYYRTNLYDTASRKLIWSGLTKTWNPDSPEQIMDEVILTVLEELRKTGMIQAQTKP